MCAKQPFYIYVNDHSEYTKKPKTKVAKCHKNKKVLADENRLCAGDYMPSSLDGKSIVVVRQAGGQVGGWAGRQAGKTPVVYKIFNFDIFHSKACLGYLNGSVELIALYQYINGHAVFEGNVIVKLFFRYMGSHILLVNPYYMHDARGHTAPKGEYV